MSGNERHQKILEILSTNKYMKPNMLAQKLFVSLSTMRRDLIELEEKGMIKRYRGNVELASVNTEFSSYFREASHPEDKAFIAELASNYIENGQTIFIDSSSTTNKMCGILNTFYDLTIITNGLKSAMELSKNASNKILMVGGEIKTNSTSVLGEFSVHFIEQFTADLAIFSCKGLDLTGVYDSSFQQGYFKNCMIQNASKKLLLCDGSKFCHSFFYKFADFKDIDYVLTNEEPAVDFVTKGQSYACEFVW